jgi:hypothetical protein
MAEKHKNPAQRGLITPGNIDLQKQPIVKNPDGSSSTVRSLGVNIDGQEVLIPTVAHDGSRILSDEEAIQQYKRSGKHLGIFDTPKNSTAYAVQLHKDYESGKIQMLNKLTNQVNYEPGAKEALNAIPKINSPRYEAIPQSMLQKVLGALFPPHNPNIIRQEIPFMPAMGFAARTIGGMTRAGEETAITKEMMERFAEQRAADVAKAQAEREAVLKLGRPNDLPIGTVTEVAPKIMEVGPPAGRLPTMNIPLSEMFRKMVFGGQ